MANSRGDRIQRVEVHKEIGAWLGRMYANPANMNENEITEMEAPPIEARMNQ